MPMPLHCWYFIWSNWDAFDDLKIGLFSRLVDCENMPHLVPILASYLAADPFLFLLKCNIQN